MTAPRPRTPNSCRRVVAGLAVAAATLALALPARALTDEEVYRNLRFQTGAPGARALGMGGAFIGVADDPGAAFTNPAGLGFLDRPQVMLEIRGQDLDNKSGAVPGLFDLGGVATPASGALELDDKGTASPTFIGYAHPIGDYFVIGVSRHEWLDSKRDSFASFTSTAFPAFEGSAPGLAREALSTVGSFDMLMDVYSVSVAATPIEQVSIGLTVSAARLDVVQTVDNYTYAIVDANGNGMPDSLLRPIDYQTSIDDNDIQFQFTAGVQWRPIDTISFGAVYREGAQFDLIEQVRQDGVRAKELRQYLAAKGVGNADGKFINRFAIPDSYGIGIAFGPYGGGGRNKAGVTIAADAIHVEYADLLDGFVAGLNSQLFAGSSVGTVFALDDETEFHLGVGYTWTVGYNNSIHVRAGGYTDPDHSLASPGRAGGVGAFVKSDDVVHGTLGAGFTLKRGFYSFELDAAADASELGEQYSGTALFKF